ncbi:MAG: transporter substrate-binding domain-containing protein [Cognaticolwellia sp.]
MKKLKKTYIKHYTSTFIFLAFIVTISLSYANENKLNVSVPDFPPFNGFNESKYCTGVSVLAIQAVLEKLDVTMEIASYPYARILHSLKTGELDLALIFRNSLIENDVIYIGPLSLSKVIVLTPNGTALRYYNDLYQLKNIAVIRHAQFNEQFDQDNALHKITVDSYDQAISMLKMNRVDGVIGSKIGLEYALRQQGMDLNLISNAFELGTKELGLHLAKKSSFITLLPLLTSAVNSNYQQDLLYRLYQHQVKYCITNKSLQASKLTY